MKVVAAYIRVSTEDQTELSPESQVKMIRDYAKAHDMVLPEEYIFQDAGISGKTAKVVGEKFAKIAKNMQIIAVSHLAQIAAMSDREFLIEKREEDGKTHTYVRMLDEGEKTQEIVRLLGGESGEEFAVKHAEELVRQAKEYKAAIN